MSEAAAVNSNVEVNPQVNAEPEPKANSKPIVPICSHIKDDGIRCGTPALNGRRFCYFHQRAHHPGARLATRQYRAPIPDSAASLQIAMAHALRALMSGDLTPKQANSIMYGINLSTNLLRLSKPLTDAEKQQVVTEIPAAMEEVLLEPAEVQGDPDPAPQPEPHPLPEGKPARPAVSLEQIDRLARDLMTEQEIHELEPTLGDGDRNPDYPAALRLISAHWDAFGKLQEHGINPDEDPRVRVHLLHPAREIRAVSSGKGCR